MRLRRIKIENHSRIADLEIDVRDHLVLVGPNDVGKSSILRCLNLILGASTAQLYSTLGSNDFRSVEQPLIIEVTLNSFDDDQQALFPDEIEVAPATGEMSLTVRLAVQVEEDESLHIARTAPGGGTGRQISREQLAGLGWRMLGALGGKRDLREDRKTAIDDLVSAIDLGDEKAGFDALRTQLEQNLDDSEALKEFRTELASQLSRALPEEVDEKDLRFVPGASTDDDALSDVRLQMTRSGSERSLTEQSDGTRALFAIALYDLVSADASIVGVDEPETHLHPTSQRSLAKLLRDGGNQKIIATHSADIVSAFPADSIVTVKTGGVAVQPSKDFLDEDERMAIRWWVRGRLEPLTARRILAVEGVSDRIVLERAAELTGRDLDRLGVSLVETDGSGDMGAIVKLFGDTGFNIPMTLLIDEDAVEKTAEALGVKANELKNHCVWVSEPDLEAEYVEAIGADVLWAAIEESSLFSKNERNNCSSSGPGGSRTAEDVAAFCRRKKSGYKVRSAMVVAQLLDETSAPRIESVENLLEEADRS